MNKLKTAVLLFGLVAAIAGLIYSMTFTNSVLTAGKKGDIVITLGQDLTPEEKQNILSYFGAEKKKEARYLTITNQEERQTLSGIMDASLIGNKAVSSAYVELLDKNKGIEVQTRNITAITPFMYTSALATAGISDARVIIAAPFPVSGTAALTGIIKGFEDVKGEGLNQSAKSAAQNEIAQTTRLGQKIGMDKAEKLVYEVKREVLKNPGASQEQIRRIIIETSSKLDVKLSDQDIQTILDLMMQIQKLNINMDNLNKQLQGLDRNIKEVSGAGGQFVNYIIQLWKMLLVWVQELRSA